MEEALGDQFGDRAARGEARVQGDPWVGPLCAGGEAFVDERLDPVVPWGDEGGGEAPVVGDEAFVDVEDVHG